MKMAFADATVLNIGNAIRIMPDSSTGRKHVFRDVLPALMTLGSRSEAIETIDVICLTCGKEFKVYPYIIKRGEGKYCSRACTPRNKTVNCLRCGKEFKAKPANLKVGKAKYCSVECASKSRQKGVEVPCELCGTKFYKSSHNPAKFCSRECADLAAYERVFVTCLTCKKEFTVTNSAFKRGEGKYCSPRCYYMSRVVRSKCKCLVCGKEFETTPAQIKAGKGRFCSTKCGKTGKYNPSFNNWISFEPYCPKFNREFKERVRAFFGFRCIICGKTEEEEGKNLSVHHVDYDKNVCCNDHSPAFACVCNKHNATANHDRERWQYIFHRIIDEIFDGRCYYTKDEYYP
ncbi:MAG: hypothetical protein WC110_09840 [Bacteroidales bacterium]|jgi:hypothetical protein